MRASHREIRKRILERKSQISDEEFFTSRAYRGYMTDITESATKRYRRPITVALVSDKADHTVAYTSPMGIWINVSNHITDSMPTRELKSISLEGLDGHEIGHNLYTDMRVWERYFTQLLRGKFYPSLPQNLDGTQQLYAEEIQDALLDALDDVPRTAIFQTAKVLENILEDGYVDARMTAAFPGRFARGIALNNVRYSETVPDLQHMVNQKYYDHSILLNLLIQYVRVGEVNNLSEYQGEFMDKLLEFIPVVDECIRDEDARSRCFAVTTILIGMWPILQRCFDALRQMQQDAKQQCGSQQSKQAGAGGNSTAPAGTGSEEDDGESDGGDGSAGGSIGSESEDSDDGSEEDDAQAALQAVIAALAEQLPQLPNMPDGKSSPIPSTGTFQPAEDLAEQLVEEAAKVLAEETARLSSHVSQIEGQGGEGSVSYNTGYTGSGYSHAASDTERMLEEMAEAQVYEAMEEELSEELQCEANSISYGNAHRGVHVIINRMAHIDQELIDAYNTVAPDLLQLSKRLQRSVKPILQDKRQGGKQTGLLVGKRLNQHALYRDDGRIFCNSRLPSEPVNLAVALLVDESGSMCGSDRITRARATAIVVHDFCSQLGIPVMIMGHTADCRTVDIYSYADFDSVDRNDRYRLMDMSARYCNRDGAALRFVAEKLHKYPAEVKLLIIISDGQPNDDGYSGSAAEADLRGIKLEYSRRGVQIFAAAIGTDRDRIERIYGNGYLDISDLNQLPIMLTQLIARNLPK